MRLFLTLLLVFLFESVTFSASLLMDNKEQIIEKVLDASQNSIVMLVISSEGCKPCSEFEPILMGFDDFLQKHENKIRIFKYVYSFKDGLPNELKDSVNSFPTTFIYENRKVVEKFEGKLSEDELIKIYNKYTSMISTGK